MRIGWLADPHSWGPLTRAVSVLGITGGVVLSQRTPQQFAPLDYERIAWRAAGCCAPDGPQQALAELDADVLVADPAWWEFASHDRRPTIRLGFAGAGADWDLDAAPIHPWAWWPLPTRAEVRAAWGVAPSVPVVATMSPSTIGDYVELRVADAIPAGAHHVRMTSWRDSLQFVGADLVVCSAGWASSVEARWSGVPYALLSTGVPDQIPRGTHTLGQAYDAVKALEVADLPGSHRARPDAAQVSRFVSVIRSVARLAV